MQLFLRIGFLWSCLLLLQSCGVKTRMVNRAELVQRVSLDNEEAKSGQGNYSWRYLGTEDNIHYFRRQLMSMFRGDSNDGFYTISRDELPLGESEFRKRRDDESAKSKPAFVKHNQEPPYGSEYSVRFGVE